MFFNLDTDAYDSLAENLDVPEAKQILLNYFNLIPNTGDHDSELGEALKKLFMQKSKPMLECMRITGIGYSTMILLSRSLIPEFWTPGNVNLIKRRHAEIFRIVTE